MERNKLLEIECFVFDMDGTIYLEDELIDGAKELLNYLNEKKIKYYFLTNNSSKNKNSYLDKLYSLSLDFITKDQIITSGDVTIKYINDTIMSSEKSVYLVGTKDLKSDFMNANINVVETYGENVDAVIVGFDTSFTYEKASIATRYIRKGVPFIATHLDLVCPIKDDEFIPDCGAITKMIEASTQASPKFMGKPCQETVNYLVDIIGVDKSKIAIVGDRLATDIATGVNNGMMGIAVLSGETSWSEIKKSKIKPTIVFDSVRDIYDKISQI